MFQSRKYISWKSLKPNTPNNCLVYQLVTTFEMMFFRRYNEKLLCFELTRLGISQLSSGGIKWWLFLMATKLESDCKSITSQYIGNVFLYTTLDWSFHLFSEVNNTSACINQLVHFFYHSQTMIITRKLNCFLNITSFSENSLCVWFIFFLWFQPFHIIYLPPKSNKLVKLHFLLKS